ncbi:hypothetical protein ACFOLC_11305 [Lysobacter cavernae]|uniref:Cytochrome c domain-containing protein n=1 Tax=Lysobacter cavernae TaxID=1685901 RepID=A0ABV7RQ29_9GAMM
MRRHVPLPMTAALVGTALALLVAACRPTAETPQPPQPRWAVNPARTGPDRPPLGHSLFDSISRHEQDGRYVQDIPFPFDALLRRIDERAGCDAAAPCSRAVLIPLGRSLQRLTASPDFFAHPRVVAAVDGEGARATTAHALLKDRLYLGYQEQAGLIEVISYNEAAGRFEFQLVHDYRAGTTPRVSYARRDVCAACHQNLAPIFSRPVWAETNANPRVAAALQRHGDAFFGVPVRRGVDIPGAIDASTDRANLFGVWQRLWRDGCGGNDAAGRRCRGAALLAALQYRLSGERGFDERAARWRVDFLPAFLRAWRARWPAGLAIPNPDLANRDPLPPGTATEPTGAVLAGVPARFEPLLPRPPLEVWRLDASASLPPPVASPPQQQAASVARRTIAGLGGFFSAAEIIALDRHLHDRGGGQQRQYVARCTLERTTASLRFDCDQAQTPATAQLRGRLLLRGARIEAGTVDGLAVVGHPPLHQLTVAPGTGLAAEGTVLRLQHRDLRARLADGAVIDRITLRWPDGTGGTVADATITVIDDLAPLRAAIAALSDDTGPASPFAAQPFDRPRLVAALFSHLGMSGSDDCCDPAVRLPPPRVEAAAPPTPSRGPARPFAAFYPPCAGCHATGERSPPNFLAGTGAQVAANMAHCAPRLYARLAMWRREPALREKTPMPPPLALPYPHTSLPPAEAASLERTAAELLRIETGRSPQLDALLVNDYEALRPCLP